jgi:microcystin-dependent protein
MSLPYVGEIRMFGGNFAPNGWMFCAGQLLPIAEYEVLFQLIGTTYGGDGQQTFALPDLQGRIPIHMGNQAGTTFLIGEKAGVEEVTLNSQQIPVHNHPLLAASGFGSSPNPQGEVLAESSAATLYQSGTPAAAMAPQAVGATGGSQPHTNLQPYLCVDFIISLFGVFPSQT